MLVFLLVIWTPQSNMHGFIYEVKTMCKSIFIILLLPFLLAGCKKDKHEEPDYLRCIEHHPVIDPVDYYQQPTSVTNATLNPNNPDQIVFLRRYTHKEAEVVVYDRSTRESKTIIETWHSYPTIDWSADNWILITGSGIVHKVRPDGTALTELTDVICPFNAIWNQGGTMFMVSEGCGTAPINFYDPDGILIQGLDSIFIGPSNYGAWNHPQYYVAPKGDSILVIDPISQEKIASTFYSSQLRKADCVWISETEYAYFLMGGIFITNYVTGTTQQLESICSHNTVQLYFPNYNPQSNSIIGTMSRLEEFADKPTYKSYIFEYDLDTFELSIIE